MKWKGLGFLSVVTAMFLLTPFQIHEEERKVIGQFAGYEWGTTYDEITQEEIMEEDQDRITLHNARKDWGKSLSWLCCGSGKQSEK